MESKDEFIKSLGDNVIKGYKMKKLKALPSAADTTAYVVNNEEAIDMEIEDSQNLNEAYENVVFTRPMPPPDIEYNTPTPPPLPPPSGEESSTPKSPSLADLVEKQKLLLQELNTNVSIASNELDDSLIDDVLALEAGIRTPETKDSCQNATETCSNDIRFQQSYVGTPIYQHSPYDKLPAGENFMVGVNDVINFENLPDSTGKYEQMKGVIKKVREVITKLNNEDD